MSVAQPLNPLRAEESQFPPPLDPVAKQIELSGDILLYIAFFFVHVTKRYFIVGTRVLYSDFLAIERVLIRRPSRHASSNR